MRSCITSPVDIVFLTCDSLKEHQCSVLKMGLLLVLSATMENFTGYDRIIFVQKSAVFWNSYYLVSKRNVRYCQLYKYEHMSFVTLSKSCTFSGGLMYISRRLDEEKRLIFWKQNCDYD